jgi:hypothetical protein
VSLTWTAPAATGGYAITDYTIQYSSNSGSSWTTFSRSASTATSVAVTGLNNGTAYLFRVAAVTVLGTGAYSTTFSGSPAGSLLSFAYTAGSWNGTGASGSPYTSSSSFGPINNAVLPFTFTATAECDVIFSMTQFNATANDNHASQDVTFKINSTTLPTLYGAFAPYNTVAVSRTVTYQIRLNAGETLYVYVAGYTGYDAPTDKYTSISCYGVAPRNSKLWFYDYGGVTSWTGAGTASDPFTATSASTTRFFTTGSTVGNYVHAPTWVAIADGTAFLYAYNSGIADDNNQTLDLQVTNRNTVSIGEGVTATRSTAMSRGAFITLYGGSNMQNLKVWAT